ncbi:cytochrome subunit of sulfide dehydrogenase [Burkholderiales bacterium]|nr:MAG: c-type cytochrome [Burkholderiales bacterium]CAG0973474.1 cytochrome subunit of sulfide dehydrogenase [Burkholderiales bacterium]
MGKTRGNACKAFTFSGILLLMTGYGGSALAQSAAAAMETRLMAASCAACHGHEGRSTGVGLPLAGQPAETLYTKLIAFKTGKAAATVMHQHAKGYSDQELRHLAEFFSGIKEARP